MIQLLKLENLNIDSFRLMEKKNQTEEMAEEVYRDKIYETYIFSYR